MTKDYFKDYDFGPKPSGGAYGATKDYFKDYDFSKRTKYEKQTNPLAAVALGALDWPTFGTSDDILGFVGGLFGQGSSWGDWLREQQRVAQIEEGGLYAAGGLAGSMLTGGLATKAAGAALGVGTKVFGLGKGVGTATKLAGDAAEAASKSTMLQRSIAMAPAGAVGGAISGAGSVNGDITKDWRMEAAKGALGGAIAGPLIYGGVASLKNAAVKQFGKVYGDKVGYRGKAASYFNAEREAQGQSDQSITDNLERLTDPKTGSKHAWFADALENEGGANYGSGLIQAASGKLSPSLTAAKAAAKERNIGVADDTIKMIWGTVPEVGKRRAFHDIMSAVGDEDEALSGVYDAIASRKLTIGKDVEAIIKYPDTLQGAMTRTMEAMVGLGAGVAPRAVTNVEMQALKQNPRFWQRFLVEARKDVDNAFANKDPMAGKMSDNLGRLRSTMGSIPELGADWKAAQAAWSKNRMIEEESKWGFNAVMEGRGDKMSDHLMKVKMWDRAVTEGKMAERSLKRKTFANPGEEQTLKQMAANGTRAKDAREAARQGMVARLEDDIRKRQTRGGSGDMYAGIGNNTQHRDSVMRLLGARVNKDGTYNQSQKIAKLMSNVDESYKLFDNVRQSNLLGGSPTAKIEGGGKVIDAMADSVDVTGDILSGNILGAALKALNKDKAKAWARESPKVYDEIMRLVTMPAEQAKAELAAHGGMTGFIFNRSTLDRVQRMAAASAKQPMQNAHNMAAALGGNGLYSGMGGGELVNMFSDWMGGGQ